MNMTLEDAVSGVLYYLEDWIINSFKRVMRCPIQLSATSIGASIVPLARNYDFGVIC